MGKGRWRIDVCFTGHESNKDSRYAHCLTITCSGGLDQRCLVCQEFTWTLLYLNFALNIYNAALQLR
ncbi:hypothetical protein AVEN_187078-1, partial [Araneus ventricosus]